ncbi:MAG: hypothetical protein JNM06_16240, partial [Blastocatellia bacterium]|nr:hypothetical protein [Blastocatellia bacterium]
MKSHLENPFRILGVNANISRRVLRELQQFLRTRLKIKQKITVKDPLAFLGNITATEIIIREATSYLDKPNQRLKARLFWFTNTCNIDEKALSFLLSNELQAAIDQWQMDDQINSKVNLARLYLFLIVANLNNTIKYWEKALALWQEVLASEKFWLAFTDWEMTSGFEPPATNLDLREFRTQALSLVLEPFQHQLTQAIASENTYIAEQLLKLLTISNLPKNLIKTLEKSIFEEILANTSRTLDKLLNSLNKSFAKEGQLLESKR